MKCSSLVSVVTPCYNHEAYLDDYFDGLVRQTYTNAEVVLIDDGSSDNSWQKIQSWAGRLRERFARVALIRQENVGFHRAIARALSEATGEYVCFLESDDYYYPEKLAKNVLFLESHPEFGVVHSDTDYVYSDRVEHRYWAGRGVRIPTGRVLGDLLADNFVMTCSMCCRTELMRAHVDFLAYKARGYLMGDYPMCLDLAVHTQFGYLDEALACYRVLRESASHSENPAKRARFAQSYKQIKMDYIRREFIDGSTPSRSGQPLPEEYLRIGYFLRESGSLWDALRCYYRLGQRWGWDRKTVLAMLKLFPARVARKLGLCQSAAS